MNDYWLLTLNKTLSAALLLWAVVLLVRVYPCLTKEKHFISPTGLRMGYGIWALVFLQAVNNLSFIFIDSYNAIDPAMKLTSAVGCIVLHLFSKATRNAK